MSDIKIHAQRTPWGPEIELMCIMDEKFRGACISWESMPENAVHRPTFIITKTAAQVLMNQLWDCGLRPSNGSGSAGT